jgi:hypothetical protein
MQPVTRAPGGQLYVQGSGEWLRGLGDGCARVYWHSVLVTLIVAEVNMGLLLYVAISYALTMYRAAPADPRASRFAAASPSTPQFLTAAASQPDIPGIPDIRHSR